jgi:ADP-ribose pyrophosphatase YjhB (NUDIX family)
MEPNHTYSAGGVVVNPDGHILIVNQNYHSWSFPKGHIDPGEDELTAAIREIYEESGVKDLELVTKLGSFGRFRIGKSGSVDQHEYKTITLFHFRTEQYELAPQDADNPEARWVQVEEVTGLLSHPADQEFFRSIQDQLKEKSPKAG